MECAWQKAGAAACTLYPEDTSLVEGVELRVHHLTGGSEGILGIEYRV